MSSLAHSTARLCDASVENAIAHLSTVAGMARWTLGLWNCRELEPGLLTGESLFDGTTAYVRVTIDAERGLVDYSVGASPQLLVPRIRATVIAGEVLGHAPGTSVVTLEAWRTASMSDARWADLTHGHETEIALIAGQLGMASSRRLISSGSPWEELAGYSRAVVQDDWVFVSGTVGQDFATMTMPELAAAQAEQALDTIEHALAQAGATVSDIVRVHVYASDRNDVPSVSAVLKRRLGQARPANTTVICALAVDGAKVELEVTAKRRTASGAPSR